MRFKLQLEVALTAFAYKAQHTQLWITEGKNSLQGLGDRRPGHELGSHYSHDLSVERLDFFKEEHDKSKCHTEGPRKEGWFNPKNRSSSLLYQ